MPASLFSWLGGKLGGFCALLLALGLAWQTARIDGVPLLGGGLKAEVAALRSDSAARDLKDAKTQAALLRARAALTAQGRAQARAHAVQQARTETQIRTVIEKVPIYVDAKSDAACILPWGFVRLLDAAASGADPDFVRAHLAPGQPDDAASGIALSEALALLTADLGIARQNAGQLEHLEAAVKMPVQREKHP
jgi:hypothetical protein